MQLTGREEAWLRDELKTIRRRPASQHRSAVQFSKDIRGLIVLNSAEEVFSRSKRARILNACRRFDSTKKVWIGFAPDETEEELEHGLEIYLRKALQQVEKDIGAEVGHLIETSELTPGQRRKLRIAAKGTCKRIARRWTAMARAAIARDMAELPEDRDPEDEFQTPIVGSFCLLDEPIWLNAIEEIDDGGANRDQLRDALAAQMMMTLDAELWLRVEQREPLRKLIRRSIQRFHSHDPVAQSRAVLADVLSKTPREQVAQILTVKQLAVWDYLPKMPTAVR